MKAGYSVYLKVNYKRHNVLEVCNDNETNEVVMWGLRKIESYDISKDENTVGVWKLKQLKN